ncbi:M4 family metallopeptidase [Phycicoccus sp. MAQZ13P-2]|uniref:protealysin inhibitor emfourin n=1 Tax=Phycicoccus mangrovi TaxID=2840470 RepID=UPI001C00151C|nr:protealysin inhibitor emfourin [Phycicoccus mangrovi]MBT9257997.1 M4 family metallopeptidase [Phycicoccus mangrovi]MBT9275981.1 M4 family metallopeptidase [Phycicoccus mangrovi]
MTHSPARCSIVPPYLLAALAASGDDHVAQRADATLRSDAELRRGRVTAEARPGGTTLPGGAAGTDAGPQRTVHDAQQGTTLPGVKVRGEGDPATADTAVTEAYDGLGATWQLWQEAYGRNSLDGKGLPLVATVHYGRDYDNAFWDGAQMVFGDGDGEVFLGFTRSLDVIGHELAHGVTQYTAGLNYQGQSGALNESVSDVFGVLVKQHSLGQDAAAADWLIGADLLAPGVKGVALRSMAAPGTAYDDPRLGKDPQPAHLRDYVETSEDNGGVHINSGIPNKAFHDLAVALGGNAWEVAGQVWFDTIVGEIRADCDFATFAGLTLAAATARHGEGSREAEAVRAAWSGVGVEIGADAPAPGSPAPQTPGTPVPDAPAPGTELEVRRTGGFAGRTRTRTVVLGELPEPDNRAWQDLIATDRLRTLAAGVEREYPDAYCYGVRCAVPEVDVVVPEPVLTDDVRDLFERTLRPHTDG